MRCRLIWRERLCRLSYELLLLLHGGRLPLLLLWIDEKLTDSSVYVREIVLVGEWVPSCPLDPSLCSHHDKHVPAVTADTLPTTYYYRATQYRPSEILPDEASPGETGSAS